MANWWLFDGSLPDKATARSLMSIAYLGVVGSALGFSLYFHVLRRLSANHVALITLSTPILALFIGVKINGETISVMDWMGTAAILTVLICYQRGDRIVASRPKLMSRT